MTFVRVAAALLAVALASSSVAAKDTWIGLRTAHLTIVSNATEGATRNVARRLERFVDVLSALLDLSAAVDPPITAVVFKNDASFEPFRPKQNGRTMNLSGYFQRADDEHLIALSLETAGDHPYRVVYHEYAHALTVRSTVVWPLWLQEGLAEFYSTFEADNRRIALGQPLSDHVRLLRQQRLLPLQALFEADRGSSMYTEERQDIFYAESWALVHYLMAGDKGRHRQAFVQFVNGLSAGLSADRAFAEAFGDDRAALEEELRRYIADGRYAGVNMTVDRPVPSVNASIRPLAEVEAEVLQGSLLMRVGRGDEAEPRFARAHTLDPKAPRLEESLGFLALNRGRHAEAVAHLERATAQEPSNALAYYYYAETIRRQVMEQGRPLSPDVARAMATPLRTAIALRPTFARAYYLLGYVHLVTGEDLPEGLRMLETAIRLAPPNRAAMLTLASIQLKMRDYAAAKATAQAILDAPDATAAIKAEAKQVMETAGRRQPLTLSAPDLRQRISERTRRLLQTRQLLGPQLDLHVLVDAFAAHD